jgi:hypothetical protein
VRLVCAAWKAVHDAVVKRLVLKRSTTDEAMGMLVRRFPAVVSLEMERDYIGCPLLTDVGVRAVRSLTFLRSLNLIGCELVTDEGVRAVSSCTALTSLDFSCCEKVTDAGVRALSNLPALKSLELRGCCNVTTAGVQALRSTTVAPNLHIVHVPVRPRRPAIVWYSSIP